MRGALVDHGHDLVIARIIPADAGSTVKTLPRLSYGKDHPRGCGEHVDVSRLLTRRGGSSPRMRGALSVRDTYL